LRWTRPACAGCAHHSPVLATCVGLAPFAASPAAPSAIPAALGRPSCIRLAADITLGLAPSCYILQSSCPALPTAFAPSYPGQFSQRFNFGLAPSAALSGRASNGLSACAVFPPSARTGDQLQLSSRAAHLARPQCNSWLAPQVTRLWLRRRSSY